jgi:putative FmdB family regulatory protein
MRLAGGLLMCAHAALIYAAAAAIPSRCSFRTPKPGKCQGRSWFAAIIQGFASNYQIFIRIEIMPIYAYRCESCGFDKDVLQKMSDAPLTQCPSCGADAFRKQVTAAGFQLKGSGWYVTDFRGGNNGGASAAATGAKNEKGGEQGASGESAASSEGSKPAEGSASAAPGAAAAATPAASPSSTPSTTAST